MHKIFNQNNFDFILSLTKVEDSHTNTDLRTWSHVHKKTTTNKKMICTKSLLNQISYHIDIIHIWGRSEDLEK